MSEPSTRYLADAARSLGDAPIGDAAAARAADRRPIEWYDSHDVRNRTRALTLWASDELTLAERDHPSDVWSPPRTLAERAALTEAEAIAAARGLVRA